LSKFELVAVPLSRSAFEPFGDVIETAGYPPSPINQGWAERYHDLAQIDVTAAGGRPLVDLVRTRPRTLPMSIKMVERHALGSQAFVPLARARFIVVVAPAGATPKPSDLRAFTTNGQQGVNYRPGVWIRSAISSSSTVAAPQRIAKNWSSRRTRLRCACDQITERPSGFAISGRSQARNCPRPGLPTNLPSRHTASPREKVATGQPVTDIPS
jgi:ureidoglycolate lyase